MATTANTRLADELIAAVGAEHVLLDDEARTFFSHDLSVDQLEIAAVVVQPGSTAEVAAVVRAATAAGAAVVPRGGGMSYSHGYVPKRPGSVLLDLRRLNSVEVNSEDMYVVAGAGATWESIYLAAAAQGVRAPYWGPMSGRFATVGGTLSQGSLFWGSARYGYSADQVRGLEVVLADGATIRTGSWAHRNSTPFTRYYGPDLSGLFLGDTGALGIKTRASLKLVPFPPCSAAATFGFDTPEAFAAAIAEMARLGLASELFGFDPAYNDVFAEIGFGFLRGAGWTLNAVVEGVDDTLVDVALELLVAAAERHGGRRFEASLPLAIRADPYGSVELGFASPDGELMLPIHAIVPLSGAAPLIRRVEAWVDEQRPLLEANGIRTVFLSCIAGTDFLYEPVFYWQDALDAPRVERFKLIERPDLLERWLPNPPRPEARAIALRLRHELADVLTALGATHMQIGKFYDYRGSLEPATFATLAALKAALDPRGLVNPGSLGLDKEGTTWQ